MNKLPSPYREFTRYFLPGLLMVLLACSPAYTPGSDVKAQNMEVNKNLAADSTITAMIQPYKADLDREISMIIGWAGEKLDNAPGRGESKLGNFVADLLLIQSEKKYGEPIDMAIINAHGGLRSTISQGPISMENIFELMPFENNMLVLELSGSLTRQFFDNCAKTKRNNIAEAKFTVVGNKATDISIGGKPFDPNRRYTLTISDYLANGGGGFGFLSQAKVIADLNYKTRDMIIDHIKDLSAQKKKAWGQLDGRIKIIN
ncbi:5'-nucleotidase C-terminal domain-containing protein [Fulvivirgaceae bacterium BMA12]|uniref:5'-nucleotidase C-terminal domain-containing protein n=1 Tax=Agaribacillus aureus TaxID=3051825 RepID=A0ABT8L7T3_9BACT|nr:5'-nucleotidase C-terminal domain-containing protein [Fulvivirgaceae bacterium BMA12]